MIGILTFSDGFAFFVLLAIGLLAIVYGIDMYCDHVNERKLSHLTVHKCKHCGFVFAIGRFANQKCVTCPSCFHKQVGEDK